MPNIIAFIKYKIFKFIIILHRLSIIILITPSLFIMVGIANITLSAYHPSPEFTTSNVNKYNRKRMVSFTPHFNCNNIVIGDIANLWSTHEEL